ncbi:hypothetical protein [Caloramator australicus]|uniref:Uncharacterized protein n=1 Tax=Caloramator australicus RC3 TaxID=857293 RepID=G0V4M6_9CLOT|nr:hypothetical protein [Caloramator australicus]CCC58066.1 hypothetical protein CAAU_0417 [Caloramator australicus RC3]
MGDKQYLIDISRKEFKGDILDISYEGANLIIQNVNEEYEKDFKTVKDINAELGKFDTVLFFLSINKYGRKNLKRLLNNLKNNLNDEARIMIWDINYRRISPFDTLKIKVIKKNNKIETLSETFRFKIFSLNSKYVEKILFKNGYKILKLEDDGILYYIEATYGG